MNDLEAANRSIDKLKNLKVNAVYPGHGQSFKIDTFLSKYSG